MRPGEVCPVDRRQPYQRPTFSRERGLMAARLSAPTRLHNNSPRDKSVDRSSHAGHGPARRLQRGVRRWVEHGLLRHRKRRPEPRPRHQPMSGGPPPAHELPPPGPPCRVARQAPRSTTPAAARTRLRRPHEWASDLPRIARPVGPRGLLTSAPTSTRWIDTQALARASRTRGHAREGRQGYRQKGVRAATEIASPRRTRECLFSPVRLTTIGVDRRLFPAFPPQHNTAPSRTRPFILL